AFHIPHQPFRSRRISTFGVVFEGWRFWRRTRTLRIREFEGVWLWSRYWGRVERRGNGRCNGRRSEL
ncbi:hypothetical protein FRC07_009623, partial [Ceratobasidium sp. 392]